MWMLRAWLLLLLAAATARAAPATVAEARERVDALERLVGRAKSSDLDLIAAIEAVAGSCANLGPDADPKERERFLDDAAAALLKALRLERVDEKTNRNLRNEVQLAAARALRHLDPEEVPRILRVIERHILKDRPYDVDPSFYEAMLDPLVRINAKGTFEWLFEKVVNPDTDLDSRDQALAGLDALLRLPATGDQRCRAMNRILGIYQSYMFHVEDDILEIAGFRGTMMKYRFMEGAGPYWESMRPTVMRALRELSTDAATGHPALDDEGNELGTLERYQVWFAQNGDHRHPPWTDAAPEPRAREAVPYTRVPPPAWRSLGVPWMEAWLANRPVLDRALPAAPWRDELRAKTLPPLVNDALKDPVWHVRAAAAVTLGRIAAPGAAALLRQRIDRDPVEEVREAALLGLLLLADDGQRDFLRARAADPVENPRLRAYALLALGFLKDLEPLRTERTGDLGACSVRAMGLAGAPATELLDLLADKRADPMVRAEAGTALLEVKDASVLPQVIRVFKEPVKGTPVAATSAAIAAGLLSPDDAKAIRPFAREMGDTDEMFFGVRTLLAASFGRMGGARGAEALLEAYENLRSNSLRVAERGHFLLALAKTGAEPAKALLRTELEELDHDWDLGACALALALAGERTSLPTLRTLLSKGTDTYAPHGMMALALLGDHGGSAAIRDILKRRRGDAILTEGALALAILDGEKALPDLFALWDRARGPEHYDALAWAFRLAAAPDAVAPLKAMVEGKAGEPLQRAFALMALGRMADHAAPLHRLARDSNPYAPSPTLRDLVRWRDAAPLLD
jgi:HEAT repeat protein